MFGIEAISCYILCFAINKFWKRNERMLFIISCFKRSVQNYIYSKIYKSFKVFSVFQNHSKKLLFVPHNTIVWNIFMRNGFLEHPSPHELNAFQMFLIPKYPRIKRALIYHNTWRYPQYLQHGSQGSLSSMSRSLTSTLSHKGKERLYESWELKYMQLQDLPSNDQRTNSKLRDARSIC